MNYGALIFACAAGALDGCVSPKYVEVAEVGSAT